MIIISCNVKLPSNRHTNCMYGSVCVYFCVTAWPLTEPQYSPETLGGFTKPRNEWKNFEPVWTSPHQFELLCGHLCLSMGFVCSCSVSKIHFCILSEHTAKVYDKTNMRQLFVSLHEICTGICMNNFSSSSLVNLF